MAMSHDRQGAPERGRQAHYPASGLRHQPVLRKRIEEIFGWTKTIGGLAQLKDARAGKGEGRLHFGLAAYNLIRLPKLLEAQRDARPSAPFRESGGSSRWDLWDNEYLDMLVQPTSPSRPKDTVSSPLDVSKRHDMRLRQANAFFTWEGFDEMDPVHGTARGNHR